MSNFDLSIIWIDSVSLEKWCVQDAGRASFRLNFKTDYCGFEGHQDNVTVSLTVNAASVAKFERIAAFINEVMADDDTADQGLVETLTDERPLTEAETRKIDEAWEKHKAAAPKKWDGDFRPHYRPDGVPTRIDIQWMTPAELAIRDAMGAVEAAGASLALTDAITLLSKAKGRVADHVEDYAAPSIAAE